MKDQKELGIGDFSKIPNGIGRVEHRMELIYQGVVAGELTLERWVETCSTTPARMFGMYPKKGIIAPGSDADVLIWDPTATTTIGVDDKHHMNMDHSAWEGFEVDGKVDTVMSRGHRAHRGRPVPRAARVTGQFIKRGLIALPGLRRGERMHTHHHWIDGKQVPGTSGPHRCRCGTRPLANSRPRSTSPRRRRSTHAVAVATAAFPSWRQTSLSRRAEIMFHTRELIDANRKEIASLLTAEHGKVLGDALGEVARGSRTSSSPAVCRTS